MIIEEEMWIKEKEERRKKHEVFRDENRFVHKAPLDEDGQLRGGGWI